MQRAVRRSVPVLAVSLFRLHPAPLVMHVNASGGEIVRGWTGIMVLVVFGVHPYCARPTLEIEMPTGTVKWFNPTKGYGFIQPSGGGGGRDVFVHISAVERAGLSSLNEGQAVEYEIESNRGKESAVNLKVK